MLREYSNILQLQTETYLDFKHAPNGLARALQLFFVVSLIAGLGVLFGIPVQVARPTLVDILDATQASINEVTTSIDPFLQSGIPFFSLPPDTADAIGGLFEAAGESVNNALAIAEAEAERLEPPFGTTVSRVIRQFGQWISTPFTIMASYIGIAIVSVVIAKMLGGRATLGQHMTAVLLASAPLVLLLFSFIPDLSLVTTIATSAAVTIFGRLIALIALGWALIILIKGLALFHEFSWGRAAWTILVTWLAITLIVPAGSALLLGYLFRP